MSNEKKQINYDEDLTVDELIKRFLELKAEGHGKAKVYLAGDGTYHAVAFVEGDKEGLFLRDPYGRQIDVYK